jgi:hypothetical protein
VDVMAMEMVSLLLKDERVKVGVWGKKRRRPGGPGLVEHAEAPPPHRRSVRLGCEALASGFWFEE